IRLLHIIPGETGEQLQCELVAADISSLPEYQAISYAWGDPTPSETILLDAQFTRISSQLFDILSHVRQQDGLRMVWLDALCINQTDDGEKGTQIGLMPLIYRSACRTLIWLGI
ncbi:heterokaryon incompatibility protein-domain-containing protein, partial [Phaeosphaeriaceae sp. PMI808]